MKITVEAYRDIDHAADPWDRPTDGRCWNVVLYEAQDDGEPDLDGWEAQPFGTQRFTYSEAQQIMHELVLRYRGRHRVRAKVGRTLGVTHEEQYPATGVTVYRWESPCAKAGSSNTL